MGGYPLRWASVAVYVLAWVSIGQELGCMLAHGSRVGHLARGKLREGGRSKARQHPSTRRQLPGSDSQDQYNRLVAAPSSVGGHVHKEASMALWKYNKAAFSIEPFEEWLRNTTLGTLPRLSTPPMSYTCGIFYNEQYKVLFVRNRKAASSSTMSALQKAGLCARPGGKVPAPAKCIRRLRAEELAKAGKDLDAMWREYTVISNVRNPWSRAASGYDYSYSLWTRAGATRGCSQPTFEQFSRDPMVMGRIANLNNCAVNRSTTMGRDDAWHHDFYHIEPAFHCLFEGGKPVVDYLVRYEKLDEDVEGMVRFVNERRPAGTAALTPPKRVPWAKKGESIRSAVQGGHVDKGESEDMLIVHAAKFRACGKPCMDNLSQFYEQDIKLLGFPMPEA